jgi:hypothetical protein
MAPKKVVAPSTLKKKIKDPKQAAGAEGAEKDLRLDAASQGQENDENDAYHEPVRFSVLIAVSLAFEIN